LVAAIRITRDLARPLRLGAFGAAVALLVATGCSNGSSRVTGSPAAQSNPASPRATVTALPAVLVQPPSGATNMPLNSIVAVTATSGRLTDVQVTGAKGQPVTGMLDPAGQAWQSNAALVPNTQYTVTVQYVSKSGKTSQQSSQFTTMAPTLVLQPSVFPDGQTVGVGQPVQIRFNRPVVNKAAVIAAFQVTESTPVAGGWHWFSDRELHFRPTTYWPAGEQVTVTANLAGVDAGNGVWGTTNRTAHFTVGDSHVSTANLVTHEMTVTKNGQVLATYPISGGRDKYPTMGGVHITLGSAQTVIMDSATVGIPRNSPDGYYETVLWNVRITNGGEFVHAAPWSVGAQGSTNVSHGCINLSPAHATDFFHLSYAYGDVVEVTGSPRPASLGEAGTMDWALPLSQWTPAT
jgi:lipoprotein-anchoring transpeptidase ErfK/SrfK